MGHSDYRTTDKYYVHLHNEMFEENAVEMKESIDNIKIIKIQLEDLNLLDEDS